MASDMGAGSGGTLAAGVIGKNIGDMAGGLLRIGEFQSAGEAAANRAGALAEARNEQARGRIMGEAGELAEGMNARNAAQTAAMTDNAIAASSGFERGMEGIDASGIEGSENMERNLQYGKSRAEAQEEMRYEMMNREAAGLQTDMANSFSDLSRDKAAAMTAAWGDAVGGANAELTGRRVDTANAVMALAPTKNDKAAVLEEARLAAAQNPDPYQEEQAEREKLINRNAVEERENNLNHLNNQVQSAQGNDLYGELERFLSEEKSDESLDDKMTKLGITDPDMRKRIQDGTTRGKHQGVWRDVWRSNLRAALGTGGK
jgi:hypothetical protein